MGADDLALFVDAAALNQMKWHLGENNTEEKYEKHL